MATRQTRESETAADSPAKLRTAHKRAYPRKTDIVLEAAENCFLEAGYANTSMDTVAERANVSKRTIYSNFANKAALFAAVIRKRCDDVLPNALDGIDIHTADPEPILIELATKFLTSIFSRPQVQLYQTVVAASRRFPEIGAMMYEGPILLSQAVFDRFLRAQVELGQMSFPDIDIAAAQLIALLKSNLHMRLLFSVPVSTKKKDIAASAEASVRLFLNGAFTRDR